MDETLKEAWEYRASRKNDVIPVSAKVPEEVKEFTEREARSRMMTRGELIACILTHRMLISKGNPVNRVNREARKA